MGGDPLVRYRELEVLLPQLVKRAKIQVVTSAFRPIPAAWATLPNLTVSVSIDGLQPEHDVRRAPATYQKILRNIEGQHVTVHCTITSAMVKREGYISEFVDFWSANSNVEKIWMSIFTPQRGAENAEILSAEERRSVVEYFDAAAREPAEAGYAGAGDSGISAAAGIAGALHFRKNYALDFRRFQNADRAVSIWRRSGLLAVRMFGVNGNGGGGKSQAGWFVYGWEIFCGRSQAVGGYVQRAGNWLREPMDSKRRSSGSGGR